MFLRVSGIIRSSFCEFRELFAHFFVTNRTIFAHFFVIAIVYSSIFFEKNVNILSTSQDIGTFSGSLTNCGKLRQMPFY